MTPVFLDTAGLIAVWERADQWHAEASGSFRLLLDRGTPLVTTPHVLLECGNTCARRPCRRDVAELRRDLMSTGRLVEPTPSEIEAAWSAYERGEAGQAGIVDHVSFAVMRRLGLSRAFTNDAHFRAAGFETLY
ncbi:type II toxin-antitoxin system VapC family toxin [Aquisphaera insulae]|uniref:type II toxin-antitoxin system VapC family toxin n=1 Tax=Aquisphaera insulae TaxID=2712864 RepID=UPI0013E9A4FA|nr:PIN domain-containing protein [Aquisphaera insulae]